MRPRVLVVDDEPSILTSTAHILADMGFEVSTWSRADGILETLRAIKPDVVLQDVRMPGLDVDDLMARIREDPGLASTRVLLFTACLDADDIADRVQADGVLDKPFNPQTIARAIHGMLATA